jgi:hypothetical protein
VLEIDALGLERGTRLLAERVGTDRPDKGRRHAEPGSGDRLVPALAAVML